MFFTYSTRTSSMTFANIRTRAQWRQLFFFLFFQRSIFKFSFAWQMLTVTRAEAWRRQRSNFKIPSKRASAFFFFVKMTRLKAIRQTSWSSISRFPTFPHVRDFIPCMSTGRTLTTEVLCNNLSLFRFSDRSVYFTASISATCISSRDIWNETRGFFFLRRVDSIREHRNYLESRYLSTASFMYRVSSFCWLSIIDISR